MIWGLGSGLGKEDFFGGSVVQPAVGTAGVVLLPPVGNPDLGIKQVDPLILRSTSRAMQKRLYSSTMLRILMLLPSSVVSKMKSQHQTSLTASARRFTAAVEVRLRHLLFFVERSVSASRFVMGDYEIEKACAPSLVGRGQETASHFKKLWGNARKCVPRSPSHGCPARTRT